MPPGLFARRSSRGLARAGVASLLVLLHAELSQAQSSARVAILQAEERGATTASDLAVLRGGIRSRDTDTALMAIRALGRLSRPALVPDIAGALRLDLPELRAEAAHALASAFGGVAGLAAGSPPSVETAPGGNTPTTSAGGTAPGAAIRAQILSALTTLTARLPIETDADVRAAICESVGRLPYVDGDQVGQAAHALEDAAGHASSLTDRLGIALGLDALIRTSGSKRSPDVAAIETLRALLGLTEAPGRTDPRSIVGSSPGLGDSHAEIIPARDARVRRLALDALIEAHALDPSVSLADAIDLASSDADQQIRRLAMLAAARSEPTDRTPAIDAALQRGLVDAAPMVRIEALRAESVRAPGSPRACGAALGRATDPDLHVALAAIDALAGCDRFPDALTFVEHTIADLSEVNEPRGWHRTAHALVALAGLAPERSKAIVGQFTSSAMWPLRLYAAKAAATLHDMPSLEKLADDPVPQVADEARHQLGRFGSSGAGRADAPPAATSAVVRKPPPTVLSAAELRRLTAPRARLTVRGVGAFELALFTAEAPATVIRFAHLAELGYYDGLTIDRVLPNFVVQMRRGAAGAPGDPSPDATFVREELGSWPHVRGVIGLALEGRQAGEGQLFFDLVDNPQFDHQYTVFGQALTGLDVMDALLEGDVIESVEILP